MSHSLDLPIHGFRYNGVAATVVERLPSGGKFKVQLESGTTITVKADNIEP